MRSAQALLLITLGLAATTAAAQNAPVHDGSPAVRVTVGVGAVYLHQPAFSYTRGTARPRPQLEQATDAAALAFGGGIDVLGVRWWTHVGAQYLVTFFDEGNTAIATAFVGRVVSGALGGRTRIGAGPVVVIAERRPRGLLAGLCLDDCTPVVYPPDLTTGGLGLALVQEWRPWPGVGLGLEGQAALGTQRFAGGRVRVTFGS